MKSLADLLISIVPHRHPDAPPPATVCPSCKTDFSSGAWPLYQRFRVCDTCGQHLHVSARERIQQLIDAGSFHEAHRSLASVDPLSFNDRLPYRKRLDEARKRTGVTEAVVTGTCRNDGAQAVLEGLDF